MYYEGVNAVHEFLSSTKTVHNKICHSRTERNIAQKILVTYLLRAKYRTGPQGTLIISRKTARSELEIMTGKRGFLAKFERSCYN